MDSDEHQRDDRSFLILSPHLDDAVISTWHVLSSSYDVRVVSVFAGIPQEGFVTTLDRLGGASESASRVRQRRRDDEAALAMVGRSPVHLDMFDAQYRAHSIPHLREAIERDPANFMALTSAERTLRIAPQDLRREVEPFLDADIIYASTGIGRNPDHRDLARLGVALAAEGREVRLFADFPYVLRYGLPSWLTGKSNPRGDAYVEEALRLLTEEVGFERHVVRLAPTDVDRKIAAAKRYETEFAPANIEFGGAMEDPDAMRYEAYWIVRAP